MGLGCSQSAACLSVFWSGVSATAQFPAGVSRRAANHSAARKGGKEKTDVKIVVGPVRRRTGKIELQFA